MIVLGFVRRHNSLRSGLKQVLKENKTPDSHFLTLSSVDVLHTSQNDPVGIKIILKTYRIHIISSAS